MTPTRKANYVVEGLERLIGSAQTPYLRGILQPWLEAFQDVENAAWEVATLRYLDPAEGVQLDTLGALLGAPRGNLDDAAYKVRLRAQIVILRAEGVPPELGQLLTLCCPLPYEFVEHQAATLEVVLSGVVAFDVPTLWTILMEAKAAGVRLELTTDAGDVADREFLLGRYAAVDDPAEDFAHGLSSEYEPTRGGNLEHTQASS